jgi:hypothetical protein
MNIKKKVFTKKRIEKYSNPLDKMAGKMISQFENIARKRLKKDGKKITEDSLGEALIKAMIGEA